MQVELSLETLSNAHANYDANRQTRHSSAPVIISLAVPIKLPKQSQPPTSSKANYSHVKSKLLDYLTDRKTGKTPALTIPSNGNSRPSSGRSILSSEAFEGKYSNGYYRQLLAGDSTLLAHFEHDRHGPDSFKSQPSIKSIVCLNTQFESISLGVNPVFGTGQIWAHRIVASDIPDVIPAVIKPSTAPAERRARFTAPGKGRGAPRGNLFDLGFADKRSSGESNLQQVSQVLGTFCVVKKARAKSAPLASSSFAPPPVKPASRPVTRESLKMASRPVTAHNLKVSPLDENKWDESSQCDTIFSVTPWSIAETKKIKKKSPDKSKPSARSKSAYYTRLSTPNERNVEEPSDFRPVSAPAEMKVFSMDIVPEISKTFSTYPFRRSKLDLLVGRSRSVNRVQLNSRLQTALVSRILRPRIKPSNLLVQEDGYFDFMEFDDDFHYQPISRQQNSQGNKTVSFKGLEL